MSNFRPVDRDTGFLMPPSVDEWLPERHLARFVVEVIASLDLRAMIGSYRGSGEASYHPAVLLGGRIIGTWRQRRADGGLIVAVEPFRRLPRGTRAALAADAADVGRFLGVPARLEVGNSPVPVDA